MTVSTRAVLIAAAVPLMLVACHDRESDAPADRLIAPGIYSSVAADGDGRLAGQEIQLTRGSASATLDYSVCTAGVCSAARSYPVQRGRGGISFTVAAGDQPGADAAVVALTPVPDGVMLTALRDGASAPANSVLLRARAEPLGLSADARQ